MLTIILWINGWHVCVCVYVCVWGGGYMCGKQNEIIALSDITGFNMYVSVYNDY